MAWGLEARVPFLDKAFLEAAMGVDPNFKMFNKGVDQETDDDGCPKMEKVGCLVQMTHATPFEVLLCYSTSYERPLMCLQRARCDLPFVDVLFFLLA